jgi:GNAT superfamily N-acetyltransferase
MKPAPASTRLAPSVTIRPTASAELPAIGRLDGMHPSRGRGGRLHGVARAGGVLHDIVAVPAERGRGIGRMLLDAVVAALTHLATPAMEAGDGPDIP